MYDAGGKFSSDIGVTVAQDDDSCVITYTPDTQWVNASERVWPVVIDPTVYTYTGATTANQIDNYVYDGQSSVMPNGNAYLYAGWRPINGVRKDHVLYWRVSQLPTISSGTITGATFNIRMTDGTSTMGEIELYCVTQSWASSTINWNNVYDQSAIPPDLLAGPQMLKNDAKELATLFTTANSSMRTVANGMFDRFFAGTGGKYRNSTLTNMAVNHASTQAFITNAKQSIVTYLKANGGNPSGALANGSLADAIKNTRRPVYNTTADKTNGLSVCINDTWGNYIEIKNYTCNGTTFSGTLRYTIYDHFGLDDPDVTGGYGGLTWLFGYTAQFSAWYVLQHYTSANSQYKPFITYIETEVPFSGTI
jgi:hypothetical protein